MLHNVLGINPWVPFGLLLVGGYAYWLYTDLQWPWLTGESGVAVDDELQR